MTDTVAAIEAVLFVAEGPVSNADLSQVLEIPPADVATTLRSLADRLSASGSGLVLREAGGGWRLLHSAPTCGPIWSASQLPDRSPPPVPHSRHLRLSPTGSPSREDRSPTSEEWTRNRRCAHWERRGLVDAIGTAPGSGQALLYGTTDLFLEKMGLAGLQRPPPLADHVPPASVVEILERPFRPEEPSNDSRS